jgi:hypothetical protein
MIPLLAGLGCAATPPASLSWRDDLASARREAEATGRPLLVVSIVGDLRKRC